MSAIPNYAALLSNFSNSDIPKAQSYANLAVLLQTEDETLTRELTKPLHDWLSGTEETDHLKAFNGLTAIFELDPIRAVAIASRDDFETLLIEIARELPTLSLQLQLSLANLASVAASHPQGRPLLKKLNVESWLESSKDDKLLQVVCAVALIKIQFTDKTKKDLPVRFQEYAKLFISTLRQDVSSPALATALEGLALTTLLKDIRHLLDKDLSSLERLVKFGQTSKDDQKLGKDGNLRTLLFSLASLYKNLTSYKPIPNEDEKAQQKLKNFSLSSDSATDSWETDAQIDERNKKLLSYGLMDSILSLAKSRAAGIRSTASDILLSLTKQVSIRGVILQGGAAKILIAIIRQDESEEKTKEMPRSAHQALARLLITADPLLVVGPSTTSPLLLESTLYLCNLSTHPTSTLLAQFEALLALTNIASISEDLRMKILKYESTTMKEDKTTMLAKLEAFLLISDEKNYGQTMCRRAACQLINNLIMCEPGFVAYTQDTKGMNPDEKPSSIDVSLPGQNQSRLYLLLALCDVDDLPTRLAASGALAVLTVSPRVVAYLLSEKIYKRAIEIIGSLLLGEGEAKEDLQQRGLAIVGQIIERLDWVDQESRLRAGGWKGVLERVKKDENKDIAKVADSMMKHLSTLID